MSKRGARKRNVKNRRPDKAIPPRQPGPAPGPYVRSGAARDSDSDRADPRSASAGSARSRKARGLESSADSSGGSGSGSRGSSGPQGRPAQPPSRASDRRRGGDARFRPEAEGSGEREDRPEDGDVRGNDRGG